MIQMCTNFFFFQAEDGIRDGRVTGVQTCALPISLAPVRHDAIQPRAEPRRLPAAREVTVGADEALGHRVCSGVPAPQHPGREPQQARLIATDYDAECFGVAGEHEGYHLRVRGCPPHIHETCMEIRASRYGLVTRAGCCGREPGYRSRRSSCTAAR